MPKASLAPVVVDRARAEGGVPVKPIIMEWDEWALAFQSEPVTIDYGRQVPDDAPTTQDLESSGVRLHAFRGEGLAREGTAQAGEPPAETARSKVSKGLGPD